MNKKHFRIFFFHVYNTLAIQKTASLIQFRLFIHSLIYHGCHNQMISKTYTNSLARIREYRVLNDILKFRHFPFISKHWQRYTCPYTWSILKTSMGWRYYADNVLILWDYSKIQWLYITYLPYLDFLIL